MSKLFLDALSPAQRRIFAKLGAFRNIGALGDGTALMLQWRHRKSFDFDIFLKREPPDSLLWEVRKVFGRGTKALRQSLQELTFVAPGNIIITFFFYPFSPLSGAIRTNSISLFSWRDIAYDKAYTIGRRAQFRDYVDMFFVLQDHMTLPEVIAGAEKKFGDLFSAKNFMAQLSYFDDLHDFTITYFERAYTLNEIKAFLKKQVAAYVKFLTAPKRRQ